MAVVSGKLRETVTVREIPIGAVVRVNWGPEMQFRGGVDYGHSTHLKYDMDAWEMGKEAATYYLNPTVDRATVMDGWYSIHTYTID